MRCLGDGYIDSFIERDCFSNLYSNFRTLVQAEPTEVKPLVCVGGF